MTKTVTDCAIMLEAMSGFDEKIQLQLINKKKHIQKI